MPSDNDSVAERVASEILGLRFDVPNDELYDISYRQGYRYGFTDAKASASEIAKQAITADNAAKDRRIEELEAKLDFLKSKGLTVTTAKTSDRPEPYLVYVIEEGSELCDGKTLAKLADAEITLAAAEAERDGLREDIAEKYCCKIEANQRIAAAQEEAAAIFRPELEDAQKERDVRGQILDEIKNATGSAWWHGAIDWANRIFAAIQKADSTPDYQSKVTRDLVPAFIGQLAKDRDHANRMYQAAANLGTEIQAERDVLRTELTALRAAADEGYIAIVAIRRGERFTDAYLRKVESVLCDALKGT